MKAKIPQKNFTCLLVCIQNDHSLPVNLNIAAVQRETGVPENPIETKLLYSLTDVKWERIKDHIDHGYRVLWLRPRSPERPELGKLIRGHNNNYVPVWDEKGALSELMAEVILKMRTPEGNARRKK